MNVELFIGWLVFILEVIVAYWRIIALALVAFAALTIAFGIIDRREAGDVILAPCKDCGDRKPNCHQSCERYGEFRREKNRENEARQRDAEIARRRSRRWRRENER